MNPFIKGKKQTKQLSNSSGAFCFYLKSLFKFTSKKHATRDVRSTSPPVKKTVETPRFFVNFSMKVKAKQLARLKQKTWKTCRWFLLTNFQNPKKKIPCFHVALSFSCFFPLKSGEVEFFQKKGIETSSCESVWILKTEHRSGFWTHATSQKKIGRRLRNRGCFRLPLKGKANLN